MKNDFLDFLKNNIVFLISMIFFFILFSLKYFLKVQNLWLLLFFILGGLISLFLLWLDQNFLLTFYQNQELNPTINNFLFVLVLPILLVLLLTSKSTLGFSVGFNLYLFLMIKMIVLLKDPFLFNRFFSQQLSKNFNRLEINLIFGFYFIAFLFINILFWQFNF